MFASRILGISLCLIGMVSSGLFGYPYITPKFILFSITLLITSIVFFGKKTQLVVPKAKYAGRVFMFLISCIILSSFAQVPAERGTGFVHIFMSLLLIGLATSFTKDEKEENFVQRFVEIQIPFLIFMFAILAHQAFISKVPPTPFFHGKNIAGGFAAIATLQFFFWGQFTKNLVSKRIAYAFALLGIALVCQYQARAALLGLIAALIYVGAAKEVFYKLLPKKMSVKTQRIAFITTGAFFSIAALITLFQKGVESLRIRFSFWGNTLCMIKDHPLGVGPGAFEYVFQSYNGRCFAAKEASESILVDHPHNMFLEFIAEIGIPGFLGLAALFILIYRAFLSSSDQKSLSAKWINASLVFMFGNALFEFPQGTAYSLFYLSIIIGVLCASITSVKTLPSYCKSVHLALSFILASVFILKGASNILTVRTDIKDNYLAACSLDKENWRACYRVASDYIHQRELEKAQALISRLGKSFEGHYLYSFLKGEYAEAKGNQQLACNFYREYDESFGKKSLMSKTIEEKCSKFNK